MERRLIVTKIKPCIINRFYDASFAFDHCCTYDKLREQELKIVQINVHRSADSSWNPLNSSRPKMLLFKQYSINASMVTPAPAVTNASLPSVSCDVHIV